MNIDTRHLLKRGRYWHYSRRVPITFHPYDQRRVIRCSLKTGSIVLAKERRDACEIADNQYWSNLIAYDMVARPDKSALIVFKILCHSSKICTQGQALL